nr:hypothetical protein [Tanacetum cinerariifolium]
PRGPAPAGRARRPGRYPPPGRLPALRGGPRVPGRRRFSGWWRAAGASPRRADYILEPTSLSCWHRGTKMLKWSSEAVHVESLSGFERRVLLLYELMNINRTYANGGFLAPAGRPNLLRLRLILC